MKLTDYAASAARKILVYGPPKSGKTDLVGRLAEKKRLWWLDLEDGVKTLLKSPRMKKEWFDNIELFSIPDTQIAPVAVETILKIIKGAKVDICHSHGIVGCPRCKSNGKGFSSLELAAFTNNDVLVLDSGSQLAMSAMNWITRKHIQAENYDYKPDWDDYSKQGRILDRIFSICQQAPFNIVVITHEQAVEMEDKKVKLVPIGGTSQFSKTFAKYFDDVVYVDRVNGKHKAASSTTYSNSIVLGSRSGVALETDDVPNLLKLFD